MKSRILLYPLFAFLFSSFSVLAQPPCGFDILHNKMMDSDPAYARKMAENEAAIRQYIQEHPGLMKWENRGNRTTALFTIPVVVHVMHTGGATGTIYNPSDAQINGAINYLNQVFAGTYPGMSAPVEGGGVVDMEIQFALAQRTPSCGATNGINRVDASSLPNYTANGINLNTSGGCPELTMKDFARWNPADYYNIWVVNKIDGADGTSGQFVAGYAYFPGASSSLDGTVMLATQFQAGNKTLPHEIGHALNLYHTFQGSANNTQCPTNSNCATQGDRVCDTDPISNNYNTGTGLYDFSCRSGANSCAGVNYTINTESNFMSYTSCFTLFTNGQKARVQAAMSLASRSSLVDPGNLALVPCGTSINFAVSSASQTEDITGTLTGCRRYRDYSYQMTIGAAPSANATATLSYSGIATRGLDYDVTTNGNFGSPSDVLSFGTGSTTAQSFTVRIYEDGNVETPETIILDFAVNNGGGDATKGTNSPTFIITINDNDQDPVGQASGTYAVGSLSSYITSSPFDAREQRQRAQMLYRADELIAAGINAGTINSLQLYIHSKLSTRPYSNFSIKMGTAGVSNLVDGSLTVAGGMITVFSSALFSTAAGWNNFNLSPAFDWDGINNLVIEICYDNGTADAGNAADQTGSYTDGGGASQGNLFFQNGINCSGSFGVVNYYGNGIKPIIRLGVSISGTEIETAATSTSTQHIAIGSNDYFYSNNNKLLLKLSAVNAPLGCVAVSLPAAGNSWVNSMGGQRSAKVFAVTPTSNGAGTDYSISLYFDNAELDGKNPLTLKIAKTSAANADDANAGNTVLVTPTVTTLGSNTTVFTASFTGFSLFFLADAAVTLPVTLTRFTAHLNGEGNSLLQWTASAEYNNHHFDIEVSSDGVNFSRLATIASKGNSTAEQQYDYTHTRPLPGNNWYRLKQVDNDQQVKYSAIVLVTVPVVKNKLLVYPVPAQNQVMVVYGQNTGNRSLEILSSDMRVIKKESLQTLSDRKAMDISGLPAGIYFIRISGGTHNEIIRFIKQ